MGETVGASRTLRHVVLRLLQQEIPELTLCQLAVLLICNEEEGPHTVRGLAARLGVAKPAITRAVDRLEEFDLARRAEDRRDRRSVLIVATPAGQSFLAGLYAESAADAGEATKPAGE